MAEHTLRLIVGCISLTTGVLMIMEVKLTNPKQRGGSHYVHTNRSAIYYICMFMNELRLKLKQKPFYSRGILYFNYGLCKFSVLNDYILNK